jgi:hypothetical protein
MKRNNLVYLTGVSNDYTRNSAETTLYGRLGVLLSAGTSGEKGSKANYAPHIPSYCAWGMDNGCYANAGSFNEAQWLERLDWIVNNIDGAYESCLFGVAPDVFDPVAMRGDAFATIERSLPVLEKIRAIGVPAAMVFQDDLHLIEDLIPWGAFDVAFIGGSDQFKLGHPTDWKPGDRTLKYDRDDETILRWARMMNRCQIEGVEMHVGRVNTNIRLSYSHAINAQSADGTMIAFSGEKGLKKLETWMPKYDYHFTLSA